MTQITSDKISYIEIILALTQACSEAEHVANLYKEVIDKIDKTTKCLEENK